MASKSRYADKEPKSLLVMNELEIIKNIKEIYSFEEAIGYSILFVAALSIISYASLKKGEEKESKLS